VFKIKTKSLGAVALISLYLAVSGCAAKQEQPLTPEQQALKTKMMQAMVARLENAPSLLPQAAAPATQATPIKIYTESEVGSMVGEAPILNHAINFEKKADGFTVNGIRYIDPEGQITSFNSNSLTGEVTYFLKTGGKGFLVKYMKAKSSDAPVTIARGTVGDNYVKVQTASGRNMTGIDGFNTSKGLVIAREETGFLYTPGKGIISFSSPNGYHIAKYQHGDVKSTGYVLLEKNSMANNGPVNPLFGLLESAAEVGSTFGINEKKDYALMNVNTGKLIELNISYNKAEKDKGLFTRNGIRNYGHYFWRIRWFKGLQGTYALYEPNASKKRALELNSGKERILFDSIIGSVDWTSEYTDGNKLKITEIKQLGTGKPEVINDFEAFFQNAEVASKTSVN